MGSTKVWCFVEIVRKWSVSNQLWPVFLVFVQFWRQLILYYYLLYIFDGMFWEKKNNNEFYSQLATQSIFLQMLWQQHSSSISVRMLWCERACLLRFRRRLSYLETKRSDFTVKHLSLHIFRYTQWCGLDGWWSRD